MRYACMILFVSNFFFSHFGVPIENHQLLGYDHMPYMPYVNQSKIGCVNVDSLVGSLPLGLYFLLQGSMQGGSSITPKRWKFRFGHHLQLHMHIQLRPYLKTRSGTLTLSAAMVPNAVSL